MREITGNLWDYYGKPNTIVCITTNGTVKKNGECVMGRGCALEAKTRWPRLPQVLGTAIKQFGNHVRRFVGGDGLDVVCFPVKHNWYEQADLELIKQSVEELAPHAEAESHLTYVLPRPGCGNGRLTWAQVKPLLESLPNNVLVITYA